MANAILIHCKEMRLTVNVSKMDLSVLLSNTNYELMNMLVEYGAFFDRNERSIEAEKMTFKELQVLPVRDVGDDGTESIDSLQQALEQQLGGNRNRYNNSNVTGTGFRRGGSEFGSMSVSTKGPSPFSPKSKGEAYGKAVANLDQTMNSMKSRM